MVQLLIKAKEDINSQDLDSKTALIYTVRDGNNKLIQLLLENQANIYAVNSTYK
jgi:ankyrin repeat protein